MAIQVGERRLLMGNEAIALGALRAGVAVAVGYPGTPSSEILETVAKEALPGVYAEWSVNEKAAMELAAGAAIAGARALVTMKQVGLNVASDPLMSLNYVGVRGGLVVAVADDPGPISSQTEQDTRAFGIFARLAVFDPSTPEEAYEMIADAFACSERIGRPVLFRPTTRVCHSYASVTLMENLPRRVPEGFSKDGGRWVIFPRLAHANHTKIEDGLSGLKERFSEYERNILIPRTPRPGVGGNGSGARLGIASGGVSWCYVNEALNGANWVRDAQLGDVDTDDGVSLLKVSTVPLPEALCAEFLRGVDRVLVVEELEPVIERELVYLCGKYNLRVDIRGKLSGDMPVAGENAPTAVRAAIERTVYGRIVCGRFVEAELKDIKSATEPSNGAAGTAATEVTSADGSSAGSDKTSILPNRPPVLCAGCPHRASFFAVKEACRGRKAVFCGDIGCYTLGNAPPLDMVDTCLCMGAGITQAQGISRVQPGTLCFAFIGDSTFFHTGLAGVANAVYNNADIVVAILDNKTTAMTGGQVNPGMGRTLAGGEAPVPDLCALLRALGVWDVQRVAAFDFEEAMAAVAHAADARGVRAIVFEGGCIADKPRNPAAAVDARRCVGCGLCERKLGCPALSLADRADAAADVAAITKVAATRERIADARGTVAVIDPVLCTGCGLCQHVCAFNAISGDHI